MRQDDFPDLGRFLLEAADDVPSDPMRWTEMSAARHRTAINRAYYGVFLYLKYRLENVRRGWSVPRVAVHAKMREALKSTLGAKNVISVAFRDLQRERGVADYRLDKLFTESEAHDLIVSSLDTMHEISTLSKSQVGDIVHALIDIDREWSATP